MTGLLLLALLSQAAVQAPPRDARLKPTSRNRYRAWHRCRSSPPALPFRALRCHHGIHRCLHGDRARPPVFISWKPRSGRTAASNSPACRPTTSSSLRPRRRCAPDTSAWRSARRARATAGQPSLSLTEGEKKEDVRLELPRALAIEALVVSESGEPMAGMNVTATRVDRGARGGLSRSTDDRGRVRLFGLVPGPIVFAPSRRGRRG